MWNPFKKYESSSAASRMKAPKNESGESIKDVKNFIKNTLEQHPELEEKMNKILEQRPPDDKLGDWANNQEIYFLETKKKILKELLDEQEKEAA